MNMRKFCTAFIAPTLLVLGCSGMDEAWSEGDGASLQDVANGAAVVTAAFSGTVRDAKGAAVAGAQVTINGISRTTDSTGRYFASVVASANGYVINVKKSGSAPLSEFYSAGKTGLIHTLQSGYVASINPAVDSTVTSPTGVSVVLKANTLVNASGVLATGPVSVTIAAYEPLRMPGDFTAVNQSGEQVALESVGAVSISATDGSGQELNLKAGATAEGYIPVPSQVGSMPACVSDGSCRIAMWKFNESTGKWEEKSAYIQPGAAGTRFTMLGATSGLAPQAVPLSPGGLGMWNADIEKRTPACTIIELVGFPSECYGSSNAVQLNLRLPNAASTLIPRTDTMSSASPYIVLYNIRPNVIQEVGLSFPSTAPAACARNLVISSNPAPVSGFPVGGVTRFNSGAPWGGVGFPRDASGNLIDFEDVALGTHPCKSYVWFQTSL